MSKKCKVDLKDNCFSTTTAKCVDYEGEYSEHTELDPEDCNTVQDVIEDINNIIDDIKTSIDVSELGCCLSYEISDEDLGLTVKDVLSTHESVLCELLEWKDGDSEGNDGTSCQVVDECGNKINTPILQKFSFGTGILEVDSTSFPSYLPLTGNYNDLFFKADKKGVYEVYVEIEFNTYTTNSFFVGISLNNSNILQNPFRETLVTSNSAHVTTFIVDCEKSDNVTLKINNNSGVSEISSIKMVVKLIK